MKGGVYELTRIMIWKLKVRLYVSFYYVSIFKLKRGFREEKSLFLERQISNNEYYILKVTKYDDHENTMLKGLLWTLHHN